MGKKHKKKIYNTPKKVKHVHVKKSLSSFIDSNNNNLKCDQCMSTFANHSDRLYCGKCQYSITHNSYMQQEKELHL